MWRERPSTGAPILTDFARNWVYDGRWGAMANYQPQVGEQMGFFVSAGNARGVGTVTSVRERTNVVVVSLPANDIGVFAFPATRRTIAALDVDGDGRADIGVFRPSTGFWWGLASSTNYSSYASVHWGGTGDIPVPGDYDGDGKTDIAVYDLTTATGTAAIEPNFDRRATPPTSGHRHRHSGTRRLRRRRQDRRGRLPAVDGPGHPPLDHELHTYVAISGV
jgi:hypothetical protein